MNPKILREREISNETQFTNEPKIYKATQITNEHKILKEP